MPHAFRQTPEIPTWGYRSTLQSLVHLPVTMHLIIHQSTIPQGSTMVFYGSISGPEIRVVGNWPVSGSYSLSAQIFGQPPMRNWTSGIRDKQSDPSPCYLCLFPTPDARHFVQQFHHDSYRSRCPNCGRWSRRSAHWYFTHYSE
jgi:hypothetical protein